MVSGIMASHVNKFFYRFVFAPTALIYCKNDVLPVLLWAWFI